MRDNFKYMKELLAISNTILLYYPTVTSLSFLEGRLGITILFYKFSELTGQEQYKLIANETIRELFVKFKTKKIAIFNLFEIGLGISILIKKGYIQEDFDSLLKEIDKLLSNLKPEIAKNIKDNSKLAWAGVYILNNTGNSDDERQRLINKALGIYESIDSYSHFSTIEIIALFYFFLTILKDKIYTNRASLLLKKIDKELFSYRTVKLDYDYQILFSFFEAKKDSPILYLPHLSNGLKNNPSECNNNEKCIKESLHSFLFGSTFWTENLEPDFPTMVMQKQFRITDNHFSLNNGFAGLGLAILCHEKYLIANNKIPH